MRVAAERAIQAAIGCGVGSTLVDGNARKTLSQCGASAYSRGSSRSPQPQWIEYRRRQ
jgi:hypothetical protein